MTSSSLTFTTAAQWLRAFARREPPPGSYDAIIVLGCRVWASGEPSLTLARRARHGASLHLRGLAPKLVLTGGQGGGGVSEAEAAARVAEAAGVSRDDMVLETRSTNTEENAAFSAALVEARRVIVVTDAYHAFRAERMFCRHFESAVGVGSVGSHRHQARGALRELLAIAAYAARGRL